jgi:WhiB family redox-sensing transcriptional regulator
VKYQDQTWRLKAACAGRDQAIFFPEVPLTRISWAEARAICRECPVVIDCLFYAVSARVEHGMFGAKTPEERRRLRRKLLTRATESVAS